MDILVPPIDLVCPFDGCERKCTTRKGFAIHLHRMKHDINLTDSQLASWQITKCICGSLCQTERLSIHQKGCAISHNSSAPLTSVTTHSQTAPTPLQLITVVESSSLTPS